MIPCYRRSREDPACYRAVEALTKGAERFGWAERVRQSGQRIGSKVRTVAVGQAFHPAGFNGFDGLVRITTDGVPAISAPTLMPPHRGLPLKY